MFDVVSYSQEIIDDLGDVCKDIKLLGKDHLLDLALCAYAAVSKSEKTHVDLSYTYVMRKLRKKQKDDVHKFQAAFKDAFEKALDEDVKDPADVALMVALKAINWEE